MACCIALTLLVSMLRGAWFFVTGREPTAVGFAPPARRPAPGQPVLPRPAPRLDARPRRRDQRTETGRQLIVAGLSWFGIGVVGMHVFGWFDWAHASVVIDVLFHSSGIWIATWGAALLALRRHSLTEVTA